MLNSKKKKDNEINPINFEPEVALLIAAYNEEKVIGEKIKSILDGNYPISKLSIYIGSDASTDKTNEIISSYASQYPQIKLINFGGRTGKAAIINKLASMAQEDIFILTDANVIFSKDTISKLVKNFSNPKVEQVCANIKKVSAKNIGIQSLEKGYLNIENKIKKAESNRWGIVMGAEGGCYAIRKKSYSPVPPNYYMDDFYITMGVINKGGQVLFEEDAICYEDLPSQSSEEHKRKIRISIGNYQNLSVYKNLLWPPWKAIGYAFISHKVLRWFTPFFLIIILLCSILLSMHSKFFLILTCTQLSLFILPLFIPLLGKMKPALFIAHFYSMNFALLKGFIIYVKGVKSSVWEPTKRNA